MSSYTNKLLAIQFMEAADAIDEHNRIKSEERKNPVRSETLREHARDLYPEGRL